MDKIELFYEYGITEKKGIPVVSSRIVAEKFDKEHKNVLDSIRKITDPKSGVSENFRRLNFQPSFYKNEQNKNQPEYLLTRDGFTLLAMGFTGKKAMKFKEAYINCFNLMEQFIKDLYEAKADFPEFTDAIMEANEEPKHYHFSNELNMINHIVVGMNAKQFKEFHSLGDVKSIRPYLTFEQLESIKKLQRIDIGLITAVPDYHERKRILQEKFNRLKIKQIGA